MFRGRRLIREKIDSRKDGIAERLDEAADTIRTKAEHLHEKADHSTERLNQAADGMASGINSAAKYIRTHSASDIRDGVTNLFRRYPFESFATALFVGLLAGSALGRGSRR